MFVQAKEALSGSSYSDYLVVSRAVLGWRKVQHDGNREDRDDFLERHTLSKASLRFINGQSFTPCLSPLLEVKNPCPLVFC